MRIILVGINARYTHSCLALFYVRNELVRHCNAVDIRLAQYTINDPYYDLLLQLTRGKADYYFFSSAIWNSDLISRIVEDILKILPRTQCVVGGPQAEVVMQEISDTRCTAVIGEIERVPPLFYADLIGKMLKQSYQCKEKRRDFSSPYSASDLELHLQNRHIYYETSRGCPFACSYCLSAVNKGVYHKDRQLVEVELTEILSANPRELRFVDRTFNDNIDRCLAIWQIIHRQVIDTSFHFEMSPDRFSEEMFVFLQCLPAGRFEFEIGIQSTHQKTLDAIGRPVDTSLAHDVITRLAGFANIHLHVDLILGLPYETEESFLESFRDVFAMCPHYIQMGLLKILPGTPIFHSVDEYGYIYSRKPPYPVLANKWMDHETLEKMYWFCQCVERFVNNRYFVSLWHYFRRKSIDIVTFFLGLFEECRKGDFFQRAPTQELLTNYIAKHTADWQDQSYILELLRYDWLRCGHKFLPEILAVAEQETSRRVKRELFGRHAVDQQKDLSSTETSHCFKKGFFLKFPPELLTDLGYSPGAGSNYLCFLPEREQSLQRYCSTKLFTRNRSE